MVSPECGQSTATEVWPKFGPRPGPVLSSQGLAKFGASLAGARVPSYGSSAAVLVPRLAHSFFPTWEFSSCGGIIHQPSHPQARGKLIHPVMKVTCIVLGLLLLNPGIAESIGIKFCASRLAEVLQLICAGRGFNGPMDDPIPGDVIPSQPQVGIVQDCCTKPCELEDLDAYCRPKRTRGGFIYS
ncbi:uncharacterized protein LOC135161747 [Diachasmimorpha longicaudata]|uniref:uncharacterized protein LOC135161747 n=1 Tax=Diachasmimorpha longicaudata TaxID=58733 RepID=UPI0030B8E5DD